MSDEFIQFSPQDLVAVSDMAYADGFERTAGFEARVHHFNSQAGRTHTGDKTTLLKLRCEIAHHVAVYHAFFRSQLRHFPMQGDAAPNEHTIDLTEVSALRGCFKRTLMFDLGRAHALRACNEIGASELLTTELLTTIGRQELVIDDEKLSAEAAHTNAREQARRIRQLLELYERISHYQPDPEIISMVENNELRHILLGDTVSPEQFVDMAKEIELNTRYASLDWE